MKLYGFFQDDKWHEDVGHILIGLVPGWGWLREHRQWPPGDSLSLNGREVFPADLVADSYRDFLGYAIGGTIRTVGLIVWALA